MNQAELVRVLSDDLEITRAAAEDYLTALKDIYIEELSQRRSIQLAGLGQLTVENGKTITRFRLSDEARERLGLKIKPKLCIVCNKRAPSKRHNKCNTCKSRAYREKTKQANVGATGGRPRRHS
jgi:nucleoid DNA-binding protein